MVGKEGDILIFHAKPLPETPEYVEYNPGENNIMLAFDTGRIQNLGMGLPKEYCENIAQIDHIFLVHIVDGSEKKIFRVPFFINIY